MFKKIILTFVLLIFAQHESYGMEVTNNIDPNVKKEMKGKLEKSKWYEFLEEDMRKSTCLTYHIHTLFNNFFRKWCGIYERVELRYGELYFGTVNGIGWYPQFLNFHDHFRMGLFEFSYNIITTIYHIAISFFTKRKNFFVFSILGGLSFNIINFKIYKGLIKLNFINPVHIFFLYCHSDKMRGFYPTKWDFNVNQKYYDKIPWPPILYFGQNLKSISEIKNEWKWMNEYTTWEDKKELIIKVFFWVLNCVLLPEIYFDISFFTSSDEKQQ